MSSLATSPVTRYELSDQALLGRDLLLAPVVRPGVRARAVYFPEGEWLDLRDGRIHVGPDWGLADAALEEGIPVYARAGSIVPFGPLVRTTRGYRLDPLELFVVPTDGYAEGRLYEDDGRTTAYERGEWCSTTFRLSDDELTARREGAHATPSRTLRILLPGEGPREVRVGGEWTVRL